MYTVMMQIRKAFSHMSQGDFGEFAETLRLVLCLMAIKHIISYETVNKICDVLYLNCDGAYMQSNPDGTYTIYHEQKVLDTFFLDDVFMWVLEQLMEDELMSELQLLNTVHEFDEKLKSIHMPIDWSRTYRGIRDKMILPVSVKSHIYYFEKTAWNSYAFRRVKGTLDSAPDLETSELILCGVEPNLIYIEKTQSLYCRIEGMDAYVHYDVGKEKKQVVNQADLVGVSQDGTEWYKDRAHVLCSYSQGKLKRHKNVSKMCKLQVCKEGVKVMPTVFGGDTFKPYVLEFDGEKALCNQKEIRTWLWERMVFALTRKENTNFSSLLGNKTYVNLPRPFRKEKILSEIEKIRDVDASAKQDIVDLLQEMRDKNVVEWMYQKWNTSLCFSGEKKRLLTGKIGSFTVDEGELVGDFDSVLNGQIGDKIIFRNNVQRYEGEVYYNRETQQYIVVWDSPRKFAYEDKLEMLVGAPVLFVEDAKESVELEPEEDEKGTWELISDFLEGIDLDDLPF